MSPDGPDEWSTDDADSSGSAAREGDPFDSTGESDPNHSTADDAAAAPEDEIAADGSGADAWSGGDHETDEKYCLSCGSQIVRSAEICPQCGVRLRGEPGPSSSNVDRTTAAIFALLLGEFGAHKFYLGKPAQGALYLCFFWTLVPGLVGIVEGIVYLRQSDEEFHWKYVE